MKNFISIILFFISSLFLFSEETVSHAVLLSASAENTDGKLKLIISWDNSDTNARIYELYKKEKYDKFWSDIGKFTKDENTFVDTNIIEGTGYEYEVRKITYDTAYYGYGYLYSGINVVTTESRNTLLLFVDDSVNHYLTFEIERFVEDLICDGFIVKKHIVPRTEKFNPSAVSTVKKIIDSETKLNTVGTIILLGRIAVPYSGNTAWDGHSDHAGAWPADLFYTTPTNYWTDVDVYNVKPAREENKNIPFDGKFDQSVISQTDIQLGRIDMYNLPDFSKGEIELLRNYLDKDHSFKRNKIILKEKALLDDGFRLYGNEAFASTAWMNFSSILGVANIDTLPFRTTLRDKDYLWSYGCNSGAYNSIYDIAYSDELASHPLKTVFVLLLGSYLGDWDTQNNLLRSVTASSPSALCAIWSGRPFWYLHHMALGGTVGYSAMITQNNDKLYEATGENGLKGAHINLIGDPTLRMKYISPPENLTVVSDNIIGGIRLIKLSWNKSADEVLGYNVYYASNLDIPFTKANLELISANSFEFNTTATGKCYVMVRAVRKEITNSGSYINFSLGDLVISDNGAEVNNLQNDNQPFISPNPATDAIYISFSGNMVNPLFYSVINDQGVELFRDNKVDYSSEWGRIKIDLDRDLHNPPSGVYFIKLLFNNHFYLGKFLIIK